MPTLTLQPTAARSACGDCHQSGGCWPTSLDTRERLRMEMLMTPAMQVARGTYVFRAGSEFHTLAIIRSGTLKSVLLNEQGREHVVGFHMTGEMLGLDGIAGNTYVRDVIALEDSAICRTAYPELLKVSREMPALGRLIHKIMSREISHGFGMMLMLGSMGAEKRLAFFLLDISRRYVARGHSRGSLVLTMTRKDMGGYLGLKLESVSRLLSALERNGLIAVQGKKIELIDFDGLEAVVGDNFRQLAQLLESDDAPVLHKRHAMTLEA